MQKDFPLRAMYTYASQTIAEKELKYMYYQRKQAGFKEMFSSSPNTASTKIEIYWWLLMDDNSSLYTRGMALWNT